MKKPDWSWFDKFWFETDWMLADARIPRMERHLLRGQLERIFS